MESRKLCEAPTFGGGVIQPVSLPKISSANNCGVDFLRYSFHVWEIHPIYIRTIVGSKPPNPTLFVLKLAVRQH
eukprot:16030466-Heterocapsa_arctica.AAC.1